MENPKSKKVKYREKMTKKYAKISTQIWFPKSKFRNTKYIKNVLVHSLRTPALGFSRILWKEEGPRKLTFFWAILALKEAL